MDKVQDELVLNEYESFKSNKNENIQLSNIQIYKSLITSSLQTAGSLIFQWMPNIISIYFIGQADLEFGIDAYGLGQMWIDSAGYGILFSFAVGLETLVSQAFGAQRYRLCGQLYFRTQCVLCIMLVVVAVPLCQFQNIMKLFYSNNERNLLHNAGLYIKYALPAIVFDSFYMSTKCFLNGLNIYNLQFYSQVVATVSHIFWCYLFIVKLQLGLLGCALALACTEGIGLTILQILVNVTQCAKITQVPFSIRYFKNNWQFLKTAFPIGSLLWLEFVCYQIFSFQASGLSKAQFEANVVMSTFAAFFYQFSYGVSIASTTFIGKEMGNKNSQMAKKYFNFLIQFIRISLATIQIISMFLLVTQLIFYFAKDQFVMIFTKEIDVQNEIKDTFYIMKILLITDSFQAIITGIVRGIGKEHFAVFSFIFVYMLFGAVSSYLYAFTFGLELKGIWFGMVTGTGLYAICQIVCLFFFDWEKLIIKIEEKMNKQADNNLDLMEDKETNYMEHEE